MIKQQEKGKLVEPSPGVEPQRAQGTPLAQRHAQF